MDQPTTNANEQRPTCYVIFYNACLVGSRQFNTFGSHGAADYVAMRHFDRIHDCVKYLKESAGCQVLGVEIHPSAVPVHQQPFTGNTAFMLGDEGQGLSEKQMQLCDGFVYISQYGEGTASLNVAVAASIVLHNFAVWAQYPEREREGAKFQVAPRQQRTRQRGVVPLSPDEQQELQLQRRGQEDAAEQAAEWLSAVMQQHGGLDGLLSAVESEDAHSSLY
eukprot:gene13300-13429_t